MHFEFKDGTIYNNDCYALLKEKAEEWEGRFKAIVTSPEYGNLQSYSPGRTVFRDNKKSYGEKSNKGAKNRNTKKAIPDNKWWKKQEDVLFLLKSVLHDDGSLWINVVDFPVKTKQGTFLYQFTSEYIRIANRAGFRLVNKIIWEKIGCSCKLQGKELLSRDYEYVLHFRKINSGKTNLTKPIIRKGNICKIDTTEDRKIENIKLATELCRNVWRIPIERVKGYPTPFPAALVERCLMLTDMDVLDNPEVLDHHFGSGQTAFAARKLGWKWVGIEIIGDIAKFAASRLENMGDLQNEQKITEHSKKQTSKSDFRS